MSPATSSRPGNPGGTRNKRHALSCSDIPPIHRSIQFGLMKEIIDTIFIFDESIPPRLNDLNFSSQHFIASFCALVLVRTSRPLEGICAGKINKPQSLKGYNRIVPIWICSRQFYRMFAASSLSSTVAGPKPLRALTNSPRNCSVSLDGRTRNRPSSLRRPPCLVDLDRALYTIPFRLSFSYRALKSSMSIMPVTPIISLVESKWPSRPSSTTLCSFWSDQTPYNSQAFDILAIKYRLVPQCNAKVLPIGSEFRIHQFRFSHSVENPQNPFTPFRACIQVPSGSVLPIYFLFRELGSSWLIAPMIFPKEDHLGFLFPYDHHTPRSLRHCLPENNRDEQLRLPTLHGKRIQDKSHFHEINA